MGEAGVATLVFSSSAAVYGQPDRTPVAEDAPLRPQNVYGRTKRIVEDFLARPRRRRSRTGGSRCCATSIRPGRTAARRSARRRGQAEQPRPAAVPASPPAKLAEIAIYGDDWPTSDGTGVRDYIHVQDLAAGHVAALAYLAATPGAVALNLGTGRGHSVLEVDRRVRARLRSRDTAAGRAAPARRRRGLLCRSVARRGGARRGARRRDLDAICADAWRWQLQRSGE